MVDTKAKTETWLSNKKQSVAKLPFRLDEVPYFDTSYMCEHSPVKPEETEDESWDAPYRWRDSVSLQITSSMDNSNDSNDKYKNQIIEIPYVRSVSEPMVSLSEDSPDVEQEIDLSGLANLNQANNSNHEIIISTSANNDFEYIKPKIKKPVQTEYKNPIAELKTIGKIKSPETEDDPPFNFQGMLRKTNYQRQSIKREQDIKPLYSLKKHETQEDLKNKNPYTINNNGNKNIVENQNNSLPLTEITPGIFMQGFMVEL